MKIAQKTDYKKEEAMKRKIRLFLGIIIIIVIIVGILLGVFVK